MGLRVCCWVWRSWRLVWVLLGVWFLGVCWVRAGFRRSCRLRFSLRGSGVGLWGRFGAVFWGLWRVLCGVGCCLRCFRMLALGCRWSWDLWRGRSWGLVWGRFGGGFRVRFGGAWGGGGCLGGGGGGGWWGGGLGWVWGCGLGLCLGGFGEVVIA